MTLTSSNVADILMRKTKLNRTVLRKIANSIGNFGPMAAVIGLIFVNCQNPYIGVVLLSLGLAFT